MSGNTLSSRKLLTLVIKSLVGLAVGLITAGGVNLPFGDVFGDLATGVKADLWSSSSGRFFRSNWQFLSEKGVLSGDIRARVKGPVVSALPWDRTKCLWMFRGCENFLQHSVHL